MTKAPTGPGYWSLDGAAFETPGAGMSGYGDVESIADRSVESGSPVASAGLRQGGASPEVNNDPVRATDDLYAVLPDTSGTIVLTIYRGGTCTFPIVR